MGFSGNTRVYHSYDDSMLYLSDIHGKSWAVPYILWANETETDFIMTLGIVGTELTDQDLDVLYKLAEHEVLSTTGKSAVEVDLAIRCL